MIAHHWQGQTFILHKDRLMFWEEERILIASDLHLGKTGHFRKAGIAMPQQVYKEDLQRLFSVIQFFKPDRLLIVGDMFHSSSNREHDHFIRWRNDLHHLRIELVKGNHDILDRQWYQANTIDVVDELVLQGIRFIHDPMDDAQAQEPLPSVTGHVHPSVSLHGAGKQSLRFPCFYFSHRQCILPAFGAFTGTHAIQPAKGDDVFAIIPTSSKKGETGTLIRI